ncbi:MAG: PEP-CTERM sorting domain-containing protein [Methanosarcinaceae archaeon]|nr:PEP-CTERM sorting domain-containing protein [Methanosarcinaceae archaeon]
MKIRNSLLFLVVLTVPFLLLSASAGAALINGGFEGGFSDWTAAGNTSVLMTANLGDGSGGTVAFNPYEGSNMASITYPAMAGSIWDNYIYQDVELGETDKYLNFAYNFWTYDEAPFDNPGFMVAINGKTVFSIAAGDIGDDTLGNLDFTGWTLISIPVEQYYDPDRPVSIMISFNAGNTGDDQYASGVFLDAVSMTESPVPVPTTILLLGSGLVAMIGLRKKTKGI